MREVREEVVGGVRGRVLEIGAGTGLNFPYYREGEVELVVAIEPDPFMLRRAKPRAGSRGALIELRQASAAELPFEDAAFDAIVCTLVLCSVEDQGEVLAEMYRVLRPGGQLRFYEHVRSDNGPGGFCQDAVTPVWHRLFAGCHPNRNTTQAIRSSGFEIEEVVFSKVGPPVPPPALVRPHVRGVARRPTSRRDH